MLQNRLLYVFLSLVPLLGQAQPETLFGPSEPIAFTLRGDLGALLGDRGDQPGYHPIELVWSTGKTAAIQAKTRGHFRKSMMNCGMPPLMIDFSNALPGGGPLKLVTPCADDRLVFREYMVYKVYQLFTEMSFRVRLAKVTLEDTGRKGKVRTITAFLIEDEESVAQRNNLQLLERDQVRPETTDRQTFLTMAMFELLVANTDWSVQYRQNIKLLTDGKTIFTVPYDFDHAGVVGAPYAKPAPELEMTSVRERRYRGFCVREMSAFGETIELFKLKKNAILALYSGNVLLDEKYAAGAVKFIEEFYAMLESEKSRNSVLGYPCRPDGTGNVVIKGLRQP